MWMCFFFYLHILNWFSLVLPVIIFPYYDTGSSNTWFVNILLFFFTNHLWRPLTFNGPALCVLTKSSQINNVCVDLAANLTLHNNVCVYSRTVWDCVDHTQSGDYLNFLGLVLLLKAETPICTSVGFQLFNGVHRSERRVKFAVSWWKKFFFRSGFH